MRNIYIEKMEQESMKEELQARRWKLFIIFIEACWIALLIFGCVMLVDVISSHAEEQYIAVIYQDQEPDKVNAITIEEAPPINNISKALDAVEDNPYLGIKISDDEARELRWVLALEAQGEGFEGEIAVCEVIFNRVLSGRWGDGVHGVLSKRGQFSTYRMIGSSSAWCRPGQMEDDAISECMRRGPQTLPDMKYVYFDTGARNGKRNIKIGHHWFGAE